MTEITVDELVDLGQCYGHVYHQSNHTAIVFAVGAQHSIPSHIHKNTLTLSLTHTHTHTHTGIGKKIARLGIFLTIS